jgi:fimbrial chaperone protein
MNPNTTKAPSPLKSVTANDFLGINRLSAAIGMVCVLSAPSVSAGNFGISPLDLQLNTATKSGVLTVTNDDNKPLSLRVRAMRWTQDSSGKDIYEDTKDLVFFPKRFDIKPGEQRVVRAGIDQFNTDKEVAYRLFVEEIPPADLPREGGSRLAVLLSIGIPVFAMPGASKPAASLLAPAMTADGTMTFTVENTGNTRVRISRLISAEGKTLSEGVESRYVFPGISKSYSTKTAGIACASVGMLAAEADTVKITSTEPLRCK